MVGTAGAVAEKTERKTEERTQPLRFNKFVPKEKIFVVVALHDMPNGSAESVILTTKKLAEAIETARQAEDLGYEFTQDETGVTVYYLEVGATYRREEFYHRQMYLPGQRPKNWSINYPVIFRRYKMNGQWHEEWFNETMKYMSGLD